MRRAETFIFTPERTSSVLKSYRRKYSASTSLQCEVEITANQKSTPACFVSVIQSYFCSCQFDTSYSYNDFLFKLRTYHVNKIFLSVGLSTKLTGRNSFLGFLSFFFFLRLFMSECFIRMKDRSKLMFLTITQ